MATSLTYDVIVLGAGGAGLMCAGTAGQSGKRVLVIDHADAPGKKILISGGGRCNFTNLDVKPDRFLSQNPHFAKSALARYTQHDFIDLIDRHGIDWHEKTLGQLFCDTSAKQIVQMLLDECAKGNVNINLAENIENIQKTDEGFSVTTNHGSYQASSLVIATGGPSIPKMGATGFAYEVARQFKLKVVEPRPALVPFTLGKEEALFSELSGVATETIASNNKASFREAALFTHKGLSGPAILQISSYWRNGETIEINFLPDVPENWLADVKKISPKLGLKNALAHHLPERLAETLSGKLDVSGRNLADFKDAELSKIANALAHWLFTPSGTEGFAKAEVTIGGVSTAELSSKTMESKKIPGLYFIGEAVDVTGWLGGYNFQWAWSSGYVAGMSV
ncbi:MAG: NAD(P)/FAD-dependent oxidoreductase [Rhizobiaceae bacterium]|nr:NAD(P)/FAD-dependent oxidoreductase [Rhizobiaceae bacterium]